MIAAAVKKNKARILISSWLLIFFSLSLYSYQHFKLRSDISFFLPDKHNKIDTIMHHQLTQGEAGKIIIIALAGKNNALSAEQLATINKQLSQRLRQNTEFSMVQNGQMDSNSLIFEPYYHYRYLLNPLTDNAAETYSFSSQTLDVSFKQLEQRLQFVLTPIEQRLFAEDPLMHWLSLLKHWHSRQLNKYAGVWFDPSAKQTLLFVKTRAPGFALAQQEKNLHFIKRQISDLVKGPITTTISGAAIFALASKKSISQQIQFISVLASITLIAFLYWFFRSVTIVLLTTLPLLSAIISGIASVLLFDGFIHGITIAFGITIIGVAVDYPIHLYSHALTNSHIRQTHKNLLQSTMTSIWPMMRLGLITTIIGFSALSLSDFSGLQQLGVFAITGLITAALTSRFLLTSLPIAQTPALNNNSAYQFLQSLLGYSINRKLRYFILFLPLFALFYIISQHNRLWEQDLAALSPVPQQQKQQDFDLRKAMGIAELRYSLMLQNKDIEVLLQQCEQLIPKLNQLKKQGHISGYDMAARYLPSIHLQQTRQKQLPDRQKLQQSITMSLAHSDLNSRAFIPFINAVDKSRQAEPLSARQLLMSETQDNIITDKVKTLLFKIRDSELWTALIPLQGVSGKKLNIDNLGSIQANLVLLDLKSYSESMLSDYRHEALKWFFSGLFLILLILYLSSKRLSALLYLALPFSGAVILTIASLLLMGYSLSIFHLVTLLLVVGLGIDYGIFSFFTHQRAKKITQLTEVTQVSVIICMVSTIIMFGALALSDLPVLRAIGLTASLGAAYAFLLTYLSFIQFDNTE